MRVVLLEMRTVIKALLARHEAQLKSVKTDIGVKVKWQFKTGEVMEDLPKLYGRRNYHQKIVTTLENVIKLIDYYDKQTANKPRGSNGDGGK